MSSHYTESEASLLSWSCSHNSVTLSLSPVEVQYFKIHFHILPPSKTRNSKSPLFRFPYQNPVCISLLPHARRMSFPTLFLQLITRIIFCEEFKFVIVILLSVLWQVQGLSKVGSAHSAMWCFLVQFPVSSLFLRVWNLWHKKCINKGVFFPLTLHNP